MRKGYIILLLILGGVFMNVYSQEFLWKASVHSFFDNSEFGYSKVQMPQTMAGVHLTPEVGLSWNEKHRAFVGFDAMHEFGSDKVVDFFDPIAYYEFAGNPFRFYMGAFPRKLVQLDRYPRMFFQDSINNYRPIINGIFWEYYSGENHVNAWLDWVSRQTHTRHEAFFMGWSGRYNLNLFYGQHFGYMFHFAGVIDPEIDEGLHDNGLILTSLGVDFSSKTNFEKLEINAGWSVGLDRDRSLGGRHCPGWSALDCNNFGQDQSLGGWHTPQGFLSEIKVEYKGLGLFNTYYRGQSQQIFRNDHGSELYWGDPIYRSKEYNRADFYILFFKSNVVNLKMIWSLHFTEQQIYHQQAFYATFDLSNLKKKEEKKYQYIWDNWFKSNSKD